MENGKKQSKLEMVFEKGLFNLTYITLIPVIFLAIAAFVVLVMGAIFMTKAFICFFNHMPPLVESTNLIIGVSEKIEDEIILIIINSVDLFLLGIILLMLSLGLYDLFVSRLDPAYEEDADPNWLKFKDINGLKEKLLQVILIILVLTFFKYVMRYNYQSPYEFLVIPLGIFLIGAGYFLFHRKFKT